MNTGLDSHPWSLATLSKTLPRYPSRPFGGNCAAGSPATTSQLLGRCLSLDALLMEIRRDGTSHLARRHPGRRFHLRSRRSIGVHDCLVGTARRLTRKWSCRALAGRAPVPRLASSRPRRKNCVCVAAGGSPTAHFQSVRRPVKELLL